jgi:DNA-binding NarL/FixJ family response regulator
MTGYWPTMPRTGRPPGGRSANAKIPDALVPTIRQAYAAGRSASDLADELDVSARTVLSCVKGRTYRDLGGPVSNGKGIHAARGEHNGRAKLDRRRVRQIRAAAARGETVRSIAARYGVCIRTVCKIVNNISWKHVTQAARGTAGLSTRRVG